MIETVLHVIWQFIVVTGAVLEVGFGERFERQVLHWAVALNHGVETVSKLRERWPFIGLCQPAVLHHRVTVNTQV